MAFIPGHTIFGQLLTYRRNHRNRTKGSYVIEVLPQDQLAVALNAEGFFPPECSRLIVEFYPEDILRLRFETFATHTQVGMLERALSAIE